MRENADALYVLGLAHRYGMYRRVNLRQARQCFDAAATHGHPDARVDLAEMLAAGEGGPRDRSHAVRVLEEGVALGEPASMVALGAWTLRGYAASKDARLGWKLLGRADRAGYAAAAATLTYLYRLGRGVPRSEAKSRRWLRRGAALGHVDCMIALAQQYERSGKNLRRAFALVRGAAEDNLDAYPSHVLGYYYTHGIGTKVDLEAAKEWYGRAAKDLYPPSMYNLARLHLEAEPSEHAAARTLLARAAKLGHRGSQRTLRTLRERSASRASGPRASARRAAAR